MFEGSLEIIFRQYGQIKKKRWEESGKRREEKKKEDQIRERVRSKKMQAREKVGTPQNTRFFSIFVGLRRVEK